jgi:hypothetical protein
MGETCKYRPPPSEYFCTLPVALKSAQKGICELHTGLASLMLVFGGGSPKKYQQCPKTLMNKAKQIAGIASSQMHYASKYTNIIGRCLGVL